MALHYNVDSTLSITAADAEFDADLRNVPSATIDMAFFGIGNWLSGNYVQKGTTINDIRSNVDISSSGLNKSHFFIAPADDGHPNPLPPGAWTSYANATKSTGLPYGSGALTKLEVSSGTDVDWDDQVVGDTDFVRTELIPATDTSKSGDELINEGVLKQDGSSPGTALFQSIAVALFNKVGKNAAINNDSNLVTDLRTKFYSSLDTEMKEVNNTYSDTKLFGIYLDQGRYKKDVEDVADLASNTVNTNGGTVTNTVISYNLDNTYVNMVIQLSGGVADSDSEPTLTSAKIISIFGDHSLATHPTKVDDSNSEYSMNIFLSLKQDDRF